MLFRSTGLGKTEVQCKMGGVARQGDYVIFYVDTIEPIRWTIRVAFSLRDLGTTIRLMIKLTIFHLALLPKNWFKQPEHPGNF
jgi:hypothetical protein